MRELLGRPNLNRALSCATIIAAVLSGGDGDGTVATGGGDGRGGGGGRGDGGQGGGGFGVVGGGTGGGGGDVISRRRSLNIFSGEGPTATGVTLDTRDPGGGGSDFCF